MTGGYLGNVLIIQHSLLRLCFPYFPIKTSVENSWISQLASAPSILHQVLHQGFGPLVLLSPPTDEEGLTIVAMSHG